MTYRYPQCPICKNVIGRLHGWEIPMAMVKHVAHYHPEVAKQMDELSKEYLELENRAYKLSGISVAKWPRNRSEHVEDSG